MGSHIVLECNVKCKKLSIVPWRREETLEILENELKKNKWLSFKFPLWKEILLLLEDTLRVQCLR